jgi:hypothetical protein
MAARQYRRQKNRGFVMGIIDLWMAILVASVLAWIMSALVWMVLAGTNTITPRRVTDAASCAARDESGLYTFRMPWIRRHGETRNCRKMQEGPIAMIAIMTAGMPKMGAMLVLSFLFNILVSVLCAYMVSRTLAADASYLQVFRVAGTTAFAAYGFAYIQESIWFGRPYAVTARNLLDAFLYALLTGGAFGWLS